MSNQNSSTKSTTTTNQNDQPFKKIDPMEWAEIYGHENFRESKKSSIK